jgi:gamma-glutamyl-gamma-aminobutyrate hydrolase PuuD
VNKLIYVENDYDGQYGAFWGALGEVVRDRDIFLARPQDFDLVCFTGGEDVSPELYHHQNLGSGNSVRRDTVEQEVYDLAAQWKLPMTGICRGSQFLNVQMGGTMVQHLRSSHGGGRHLALTVMAEDDVMDMEVTSSHHQMSVLGEGGVMLLHSERSIPWTDCVYDGEMPETGIALDEQTPGNIYMTEGFVYPDHNIFAVQHHPEWQDIEDTCPQWTLRMIAEHCFGETFVSANG